MTDEECITFNVSKYTPMQLENSKLKIDINGIPFDIRPFVSRYEFVTSSNGQLLKIFYDGKALMRSVEEMALVGG